MLKSIHTLSIKLILVSAILALPVVSSAQWQWSIRGGSANNLSISNQYNNINKIATDQNGNVYILGKIGGAGVKVDNQNLTAYSNSGTGPSIDVILSSFTSNGNYRWSKVIGGEFYDFGYDLITDQLGNVYVTGAVINPYETTVGVPYNAVHFDTDTILPKYPSNNPDTLRKQMFLVKYDTAGVFQWLSMPEPDTVTSVNFRLHNSFPVGLDVDSAGNVYWLCYLRPGQFGWANNNIITQAGAYVVEYNPQGQKTDITPIELNVGRGIDLAASYRSPTHFRRNQATGDFYIAGTNEAKNYSYLTIAGDTITSSMYLACFSPSGQLLWKHLSGGADAGVIYDFTVDDYGNLFLTGEMRTGTTFGGYTFQSPRSSGSPFVSTFDANGNHRWSSMAVVNAASDGSGIAVGDSEVTVVGTGGSLYWPGNPDTVTTVLNQGYDAFIARFDKANGSLIAMDRTHTPFGGASYGNAIAAGPQDTYYVGGNFDMAMYLGQDTLYKVGSQRSFFLTQYTCDVPEPNYSYTGVNDTNLVTFTYTGAPADSVKWYLGDGTQVWGDSVQHYYQTAGAYHVCAQAFFACTDVAVCDTVYAGSISVEERQQNGFRFYPNPTTGKIYLENIPEGAQVSLYNISGQALWSSIMEDSSGTVETHDFPAGVYVLVIVSDTERYYEKVIKK